MTGLMVGKIILSIFSLVYGIILGIITIPLSKWLAKRRTDDPSKLAPLVKTPIRILIVFAAIVAALGISFTTNTEDPGALREGIRNIILLIPVFSIATVDSLVRKIPNPLLLAMLVIQAVYITVVSIMTESIDEIPKAIIGFFLGMVVCFIPSLLKIPMGAGDIKYNGVIGLCIGAAGYFESMILMAVFVVIAFVYLKISKKGGMKTLIPMGPFISLGMVIAMCFPLSVLFGSSGLI